MLTEILKAFQQQKLKKNGHLDQKTEETNPIHSTSIENSNEEEEHVWNKLASSDYY